MSILPSASDNRSEATTTESTTAQSTHVNSDHDTSMQQLLQQLTAYMTSELATMEQRMTSQITSEIGILRSEMATKSDIETIQVRLEHLQLEVNKMF